MPCGWLCGQIEEMKKHIRKVLALPADALFRPFAEFARLGASGGILLLGCAVLAMIAANSAIAEHYFALLDTKVTVGAGEAAISKDLLHWINDGLMAVFFFVVGLEIKREIIAGELSTLRSAALPIAGAIGGMAIPAVIYFSLNRGTPEVSGWGIPMATDIAFALGVMSLLGKCVPVSIKVFLTALAIIDDIGAVLVIAVFYTEKIVFAQLIIAAIGLVILVTLNKMGVSRVVPYALIALVIWVAFLKSGVHATIAGVLVALTIPAHTRVNSASFAEKARAIIDEFTRHAKHGGDLLENQRQQHALFTLGRCIKNVQAPLLTLEHALHPYVMFFIMPVFAFANAGVALGDIGFSGLGHPVALGVILGLVLGKLIGVSAFSWLAVKFGLAELPAGVIWRQIFATALLCGIGFTMSLFIANLALGPDTLPLAKLGILTGSLIAGVTGYLMLKSVCPVSCADEECAA